MFVLLIIGLAYSLTLAVAAAEPATTSTDEGVPDVKLGKEFKDFRKAKRGASKASNAQSAGSAGESSLGRRILLYLPNRFLDLIDIFKADVGVGPALGAVARVTEHGQIGYRSVSPVSLRVGLRGRNPPVMAETADEYGVGPDFINSSDREVGKGEVGVGLDLFIVGAYAGIDFYQLPDFLLGFFGVDYAEDDLS
jgi:hypothetical protein